MAVGTMELAPPDEGGDDRRADVAVVRAADAIVAEPVLDTSDEALRRFIDGAPSVVVVETPPVTPVDATSKLPEGSRLLFDGGALPVAPPGILRAVVASRRNFAAGATGRGPAFEKLTNSRQAQAWGGRVVISKF